MVAAKTKYSHFSKHSLIENSFSMTSYISSSHTPFLTIMVATTHLISPWHNLSLNSLLKWISNTRSSFGLKCLRKGWVVYAYPSESLSLLSRDNDLWTSAFDVVSSLTSLAITTAVIKLRLLYRLDLQSLLKKSFSVTSSSKTSLSYRSTTSRLTFPEFNQLSGF